MQPYFLPYIGYFQLINAVDFFVIYDDVTFIKGGWINRNYIFINQEKSLITLPLSGVSSNSKIIDTSVSEKHFPIWLKKFRKKIEYAYRSAPYYSVVYDLINNKAGSYVESISDYNRMFIEIICKYLSIDTKIIPHSDVFNNADMKSQERVLDICRRMNAELYVNAIGGKELYSHRTFIDRGVKLRFLKTQMIEYNQFGNDFIPWLSIIDVMMFNSKNEINEFLNRYELIT